MLNVDARGRSCPEPVILTKNALSKDSEGAIVLVDNQVPVDNITRFATNKGYQVSVTPKGDDFELRITREGKK